MTERKTTEIKIRVTPSEKARWQGDAEREGVSLSELICRNMNFPVDYLTADTLKIEPIEYVSTKAGAEYATNRWSAETHPAKSWMYKERTTSA